MRIISGSHKGRKIQAPARLPVRPTTDMAKEGLFNILYNRFDLSQLKILDLFSGTGNIAYEFSSRGCLSVTAIDLDRSCVRFIEQTAEKLNFTELTAYQSDFKRYLENCHEQFDLIYADPPYQLENMAEIPNVVFANEVLTPDGIFILEHGKRNQFEAHPAFIEHRHYGNVHFSFFMNNFQ